MNPTTNEGVNNVRNYLMLLRFNVTNINSDIEET